MKKAVYPGSFDPVTFGHLDIIERASKLFDEVVILVMVNTAKSPLFSIEERVRMIRDAVSPYPNVSVDFYQGLLIDYAKEKDIRVSIRGLRAVTDFEYELQISQTNYELSGRALDTVFLTTDLKYAYLSSSVVREIASFGGDISKCVPKEVADLVKNKFEKTVSKGQSNGCP